MYDMNESMVAEAWAVSRIKDGKVSLDAVLERVSSYDQVDFLMLAKLAKRLKCPTSDEYKIVDKVRDPKARMAYIMKQNSLRDWDGRALEGVKASRDGNAIVGFLYLMKMTLAAKQFGELLDKHIVVADHYAVFKRGLDFEAVKRIPRYPRQRVVALELMSLWPPPGFGCSDRRCDEIASKYFGKSDPFNVQIRNQEALIKLLNREKGNAVEMAPGKSPRLLMKEALRNGNESLFNAIAKLYKISHGVQEWTRIQACLENKMWDKLKAMTARTLHIPCEKAADECVMFGRRSEAIAFILKTPRQERQLEIFERYEYWDACSDVAGKMKNIDLARQYAERARAAGQI